MLEKYSSQTSPLPKEEYLAEQEHDEPCCWCNDEGVEGENGEHHPCAWCGAY